MQTGAKLIVTTDSDLLPPETTVGDFKIMRPLGRGGMGTVYLARDTVLGRKVALKFVLSAVAQEAQQRMLTEAQAMARFSHPHIAAVYSAGWHDEVPYFVLEYIDGRDLRSRISGERPGVRESMRILRAIADALAEAHRHGILHRDLKPDNVLISSDGRVRVLDFGLARAVAQPAEAAGSVHATKGTGLYGTPAYMAPEQIAQQELTPAVDVWAFGVVACELITGDVPRFCTMPVSQRAALFAAQPPRPNFHASLFLPQSFTDAIAQCLSSNPADRPAAQTLVGVLDHLLEAAPQGASEDSPFRGLLSFGEDNAGFFFGREAEVERVSERLRQEPIMAVVGPSGVGKSSFVYAGLVPRLREQSLWLVLRMRPGADPFMTLARRLRAGEGGTDAFTLRTRAGDEEEDYQDPAAADEDTEALAIALLDTPHQLGMTLREISAQSAVKVLLIVDQLEELYTHVEDVVVRRRFIRALLSAADDPQEPVRICFTIRDDFLGRLGEEPETSRALDRILVLNTPPPKAMRDILTRPLHAARYAYDDETLVDDIVSATTGERAALPLVQFVLRQLWDQRDRERRLLRRADYDRMGGLAGALADYADSILAGMGDSDLVRVRQMLLRMVTPEGTRRVVTRGDLLDGIEDAAAVLDKFVEARLVAVRRGARGAAESAELELAHESLIVRWRRLARWREESNEEVAFRAEVTQAAELWEKRGRRASEAWRGDALAEAERRMRRLDAPLPASARAFIEAGQRWERAARRRRQKLRLLGAGALVLVAVVALTVAVSFARQKAAAEERRDEALRQSARAAIARGELLEARAHVRAALEGSDSPKSRALLWSLRSQALRWSKPLPSLAHAITFLPDGKSILVGDGAQGAVMLVDLETGNETRQEVLRAGIVNSLALAADGKTAFAGAFAGKIFAYTLGAEGAKEIEAHEAPVLSLALTPDGRTLLSAGSDGLKLWDTLSLSQQGSLDLGGIGLRQVVVSHDGQRVAIAGSDLWIRLFDLPSLRPLGTIAGHKVPGISVGFTKDGRLLSAGMDGALHVWREGRDAAPAFRISSRIWGFALSPDERQVALGVEDGSVRLVALDTMQEQRQFLSHTLPVHRLAFSPDGRYLISTGLDARMAVWDLAAAPPMRSLPPHRGLIHDVRFLDGGRSLVTSGKDRTLRVWNVESGDVEGVIQCGDECSRIEKVSGGLLATLGNGRIRLMEVAGGESRGVLGEQGGLSDFAVLPGGSEIVAATLDGALVYYDVHTLRERQRLSFYQSPVHVTVAPSGDLIATHEEKGSTIELRQARSGAIVTRFAGTRVLAFHPNGESLAYLGERKELFLFDVKTRQSRLLSYDPSKRTHALAVFLRDGAQMVTGRFDGMLSVFDLSAAGSRIHRGHLLAVSGLAVSEDGKYLASVSSDGTVSLFAAETLEPLWRAPFASSTRREIFANGAWRGIDGRELSPAPSAWRDALAHAHMARLSADESRLCLVDNAQGVELWDVNADRKLGDWNQPRPMLALPFGEGCLSTAHNGVHLLAPGSDHLIDDLKFAGIAVEAGAALIGTNKGFARVDTAGVIRATTKTQAGVTALARIDQDTVVLGRASGEVVLQDEKSGAKVVLSDGTLSAVMQLDHGPSGTIAVGFADGTVEVFDRHGELLARTRLHGPIRDFIVDGERLIAVSNRGQVGTLDLSVFAADYCTLLRDVWQDIPLSLSNSGFEHAAPPAHRCNTVAR